MSGSKPRFRVVPDSFASYGSDADEFLREHGLVMDEWQFSIISDWLSISRDGKYTVRTAGLSVPRQNGKTFLLKARCYYGICVLGETILYTAHEVKTARATFEAMAIDFDTENGIPDLASQTEYIRRANGQEEIKLKDWEDDYGNVHIGGRIVFSARSRGAARGLTADVLMLDEAQELTSEQLAALLPVISSGRLQNNQVIMIGTPPAPGCPGDVFAMTRKTALSTTPGSMAWHEWSVDEIGDTRDWKRVEDTNPAFGTRLMRSAVESEMVAMASDYFARERLGWWSEQSANHVISPTQWDKCATDAPPRDGLLCYGVKFSPDGACGTLAVCLRPDGMPAHVEVVDARSMSGGVAWFADWLAARADKAAQIVIDGRSNSQALVDRLIGMGVPKNEIIVPRSDEMTAACSMMVNAISERSVTHYSQPALSDAAYNATKRSIGSGGGYGFSSSTLEAAALAFWGAATTKRNPNRKSRIGF